MDKKILGPRLPRKLPNKKLPDDFMVDEIEAEGSILTGVFSNYDFLKVMGRKDLKTISLQKVVLENIKFTPHPLSDFTPQFELMDAVFDSCDLSNMNFNGAIVHRTEFINCKIHGINLNESTLRNVSFTNCSGAYGIFRFSDFKQVSFGDCRLCQTDFQQCSFNQVYYSKTDLMQAQFSGTNLGEMDLSDCRIEGISVNVEDLRGVIVSPMQAVSLSRLLGLVIKE